jgi:hypothetical protein
MRVLPGNTPEGAWTKLRPNVAHLQEFGIPVWIFQEQSNISKLEPKSIKQIFVGFEDGPKAIKYCDTATHCVKTSCNYNFYTTNPPVQFEGEEEVEPEQIGMEPLTKKGKRPMDEDPDVSPRRSMRPRTQHDYSTAATLNDPFLAFDPALELAALAFNLEEGHHIMSSDELINATLNVANLASEDPQSLTEARESPDWPEWEKAIHIELDQLNQRKTWTLVDPPKEHNIIKNKWVFIQEYDKLGILTKYKA